MTILYLMKPGDLLHSRYRIESKLGHGGMGGVYLATHLELWVQVAVKEMVVQMADEAERRAAVSQFRSEAQILHGLRHPHLPRVYDFFEDDGRHYLVMEYIQGSTLDEMVVQHGPLPEDQVLRIARDLCDVLDFMHRQTPPVIFRDLKPSNVLVTASGQTKLIDFGIAKLFEGSSSKTHTIIRSAGTPGFAAPEQYGAGTDARSDVYSLGATLYSLLAALVPPPSPALAVEAAVLVPLHQVRPDVSARTVRAIAEMMQSSPARRPQSVRQALDLLERGPTETQPPVVPLTGYRLSGTTEDLFGVLRYGHAQRLVDTGRPGQPPSTPSPFGRLSEVDLRSRDTIPVSLGGLETARQAAFEARTSPRLTADAWSPSGPTPAYVRRPAPAIPPPPPRMRTASNPSRPPTLPMLVASILIVAFTAWMWLTFPPHPPRISTVAPAVAKHSKAPKPAKKLHQAAVRTAAVLKF